MAEADTRRQERQCQARQQAAKTLKRRREESGDEFNKLQHGSQAGEENGQNIGVKQRAISKFGKKK